MNAAISLGRRGHIVRIGRRRRDVTKDKTTYAAFSQKNFSLDLRPPRPYSCQSSTENFSRVYVSLTMDTVDRINESYRVVIVRTRTCERAGEKDFTVERARVQRAVRRVGGHTRASFFLRVHRVDGYLDSDVHARILYSVHR